MAIEIGLVNADTSVKFGTTTIQSGYIGFNQFYNTYTSILDLYPTSVHHAYSLRKLKSTYTGACLRIRRTTTTPSVTSTTVDLYFDVYNTISLNSSITYVSGTATTAKTLGEFSASTGYSNPDGVNINQSIFVVTWFDQSGNGKNPTQATASNQPRLVNAGNLETKDSKVAVKFTRTSASRLTINDTTANINNMCSYFVGSFENNTNAQIGYGINGTNRFYLPYVPIGGTNIHAGYATTTTTLIFETFNTNRRLFELLAPSPLNSAVAQAFLNGVAKNTTTLSSAASNIITLGVTGILYFDGYIQEVIGWQSNLNRVEKENNINAYWEIY